MNIYFEIRVDQIKENIHQERNRTKKDMIMNMKKMMMYMKYQNNIIKII